MQFIALIIARNNPEQLFACLSVLSFCGIGFAKLCSLHFRREDWNMLLNEARDLENDQLTFESDDIDYDSDDDEENIIIENISTYTSKFHSTIALLSKLYLVTCVVYIASPFVEYAIYKSQNEDFPLPHILPMWAPFDEYFCGYLVMVFIEFIASVYCVVIHIIFDCFSAGSMILICGQFSLLRDYCLRIGGRGNMLSHSNRRDSRAHYRIKLCHKYHVIILR
ncbi:unnamed protein product [Leptidea sinapis]|uniref:Odorant receptor n=1 Tax=Leptidea sinapis TaxID=189913 RepID=A0A5E4PY44_9NEOP|nr:unnamed protein product [Leptidea sinapis]